MVGSWRRRCDAWAKHKEARAARDWRTAYRHCRRWAVPGKTRCHLHGGRSTGPRTSEGKARTLAAGQQPKPRGRRDAGGSSARLEVGQGAAGPGQVCPPAALRPVSECLQTSWPPNLAIARLTQPQAANPAAWREPQPAYGSADRVFAWALLQPRPEPEPPVWLRPSQRPPRPELRE
jgi:hypothetical protein